MNEFLSRVVTFLSGYLNGALCFGLPQLSVGVTQIGNGALKIIDPTVTQISAMKNTDMPKDISMTFTAT